MPGRTYDNPGHPLYGVPTEILDVARMQLDALADDIGLARDRVEPVADAIVAGLAIAGHLKKK